jgi:hypothetical protein
MTYALGYSSEQEYEDDCALEGRNARLAAEACNDILTLRQADFALACMRQNAAEAVGLVEDLFDTHGWPSDDLDTAWLSDAGRVTWELFKAYRSIGAA